MRRNSTAVILALVMVLGCAFVAWGASAYDTGTGTMNSPSEGKAAAGSGSMGYKGRDAGSAPDSPAVGGSTQDGQYLDTRTGTMKQRKAPKAGGNAADNPAVGGTNRDGQYLDTRTGTMKQRKTPEAGGSAIDTSRDDRGDRPNVYDPRAGTVNQRDKAGAATGSGSMGYQPRDEERPANTPNR